MGCCESQHDASQFHKSASNSSSIESNGPLGAVQRAADAIRDSTLKDAEPNALRNVRLALLSLPRDSSNVPDVPERDIKEVIEILRQKSDASDLILTGLVLMRYLAQRVENQKKIASARGVSLVLHALQTHDSNPTLQGVACDTLGNLLQDESNAHQFLELRGVDSVFQVVKMSMANTRVMEAACFLLGNVASSQEGLLHISRNKGGAVALKVMEAHESDAELLRELLFLLSNLAQSPSLQPELKKAGAVKAVVGVMAMHEEALELQAMGCSALDNLLSPPPTASAGDAGAGPQDGYTKDVTPYECERAVTAVCKVLKRHKTNGGVIKRACSAVASMAGLTPYPACLANNPELMDALIDAAPTALKEGHAAGQLLRALEGLASQRANVEAMVGIAGTGRVLCLIKEVAGSSSLKPPAVARAMALLSTLCETCQRHAGSGVEVPSRVGLEVLAAALDRHWNQSTVVIPACTVLASLAKGPDSPSGSGPSRSARGPPSREASSPWQPAMAGLIRALRARPGDVAVAVSACVALAWTVEKQARPCGTLVADMMSALVMVLRAHQGDADVAEAACFLLSAVAKDAAEQDKEHMMRSGAPLLVVMVLRHYADQAGDVEPVLRRAVNALRLVLLLADSATAGAVSLAGAPAALRKIQGRFPEGHALHRAAGTALQALTAQ